MTPPRPDGLRIASLLPAATEIVCALGGEPALVGISHECDFPPSVTRLPRLTRSPVDSAGSSAAIDRQVRELHAAGSPAIAIDGAVLSAVRPNLLLTQDLCQVCAVVEGDVRTLAQAIDPEPAVVSLAARNLEGIYTDIAVVGKALGRSPAAERLVSELRSGFGAMTDRRPDVAVRVVVVEWLDPVYLGGHWVPELVGHAGGRDVGALPGTHSMPSSWSEVAALEPELLLIALCGFGVERAATEWRRFLDEGSEAAALACGIPAPVWALDGNAYTSRAGPRVIDGCALINRAIRGLDTPGLIRLR